MSAQQAGAMKRMKKPVDIAAPTATTKKRYCIIDACHGLVCTTIICMLRFTVHRPTTLRVWVGYTTVHLSKVWETSIHPSQHPPPAPPPETRVLGDSSFILASLLFSRRPSLRIGFRE